MKAKFKLSQLAAQDSVTKELMHPKHGATGIEVTLAGPTHPKWKEALATFRESAQDAEANLVLLCATVLAWDDEAMEVPYSPEAVQSVFKDPKNEWMVANVSSMILDNSNFFL